MRILVADDDEASRYLLVSILRSAGHDLQEAEDGVEALKLARTTPPDLIISDILMPRMDGYQLCREWRADPKLGTIPLVFYTANYTESDDERFAKSVGADRFLVKPMDPTSLLQAVDELLNLTERGDYTMPVLPEVDESKVLKEYNARLVNKLERQLEETRTTNLELTRTANQLLEAEQALRGVFSASPVAIVTLADDGVVTMWNRAAEDIFGWSSDDTIGGQCPLLTADGKHCIEVMRHVGGPLTAHETRMQTKAGETIDVTVSAAPLGGPDEPSGMIALFTDVTLQKATKRDLAVTVAKLSEMLGGAITAIAKIVEARDPYTAGHQERVSALATAIAAEMGLDEDFCDGVRIAGLIHDIGKVYVPAEILTKPRNLTEVEFAIVKMHPEIAYDVLASIDFPWPIADYVVQHHERIDGSGYPHGLADKDIQQGSKILAVADVVEAMSSHRPYKVASGLDAALDEIERNSGVLYDPDATKACIRLFKEREFTLPSASASPKTISSIPGSP